ncbi:hypothetical protein AAVH_17862 [Aphelenchoides avenae]|nr:hypothetical protein AAVH_17862 [Aphelenchus avenae]
MFDCNARRLKSLMQLPHYVRVAQKFLEGKMVRTTCAKRRPRCFKLKSLTLRKAYQQDAYEGASYN